jgi:hypothetical protein
MAGRVNGVVGGTYQLGLASRQVATLGPDRLARGWYDRPVPTHDALGLVLLQEGIITQPQLYEAIHLQRQTNRLLGTCLVSLGAVAPETLLVMQSRQLQIPALPPGLLAQAAPEAVQKVPGPLALQLRIVPYSWDGTMLGVALADDQVLSNLGAVAEHIQAAVGAYVALESDIDRALQRFYGSQGRNETRVFQGPPPPASKSTPLQRMSFYDATAQVYEARSFEDLGGCIGAALLNYFSRVCVLKLDGGGMRLVTAAVGPAPARAFLTREMLPWLADADAPRFFYGSSPRDPRGRVLCEALGLPPAPMCLLALPGTADPPPLLVYADNGQAGELYEDIRDIQQLLKEADTALQMNPLGL